MQIAKIVIQALNKLVNSDGIMLVSEGAGVNYRTVKKVAETGECNSKEVHDKIVEYVVSRTEQKRAEEKALTEKLKR